MAEYRRHRLSALFRLYDPHEEMVFPTKVIKTMVCDILRALLGWWGLEVEGAVAVRVMALLVQHDPVSVIALHDLITAFAVGPEPPPPLPPSLAKLVSHQSSQPVPLFSDVVIKRLVDIDNLTEILIDHVEDFTILIMQRPPRYQLGKRAIADMIFSAYNKPVHKVASSLVTDDDERLMDAETLREIVDDAVQMFSSIRIASSTDYDDVVEPLFEHVCRLLVHRDGMYITCSHFCRALAEGGPEFESARVQSLIGDVDLRLEMLERYEELIAFGALRKAAGRRHRHTSSSNATESSGQYHIYDTPPPWNQDVLTVDRDMHQVGRQLSSLSTSRSSSGMRAEKQISEEPNFVGIQQLKSDAVHTALAGAMKYDLAELMRKWLLKPYQVPGDNSCMFHALAHQLYHRPGRLQLGRIQPEKLRAQIVDAMVKWKDQRVDNSTAHGNAATLKDFVYNKSWDDYTSGMRRPNGDWGDHVVLMTAATLYKVRIIIFSTASATPLRVDPFAGIVREQSLPATAVICIGHQHEYHYVSTETL